MSVFFGNLFGTCGKCKGSSIRLDNRGKLEYHTRKTELKLATDAWFLDTHVTEMILLVTAECDGVGGEPESTIQGEPPYRLDEDLEEAYADYYDDNDYSFYSPYGDDLRW